MHWATILTALVLAMISAGLVFFGQWQVWQAFGAVGVAAVILIGILMAALWVMTPRDDRHLVLEEIMRTMRKDFRDLIDMMRFKR